MEAASFLPSREGRLLLLGGGGGIDRLCLTPHLRPGSQMDRERMNQN